LSKSNDDEQRFFFKAAIAISTVSFTAGMAEKCNSQDMPLRSETVSSAAESKPHDWISECPPAISRLIDIGHVRMLVDDDAVNAENKSALTIFHFATQFEVRYKFLSVSKNPTGERDAALAVRFINPSLSAEHEIKLMSAYRPLRPWDSRLLLHEMDHVSISTDPRLFKILKNLLYESYKLRMVLPASSTGDNEVIMQTINQRQRERLDTFEKLIQNYYVRLDEESNNGLTAINKRRDFFMNLYTLKDLRSSNFAYLSEVQSLLANDSIQEVEQHYLLEATQ